MNGIGAHTGQTYIQTFIFIYIEDIEDLLIAQFVE
jgi:predicted DNA-binding protein